MPKSPSRTSKKKKYNARFPPARIKKIMQTDEDVGKVAAAVPVIISRALELFIESLIKETSQTTLSKNAKTLSTPHIKQTIEGNKQFDFLRDLVANVPDHQTEDNNGDTAHYDGEPSSRKGRGRPRKQKDLTERGKKGESSKATSDLSDDDEEDDDEDTETDEESNYNSAAGTSYAPSAPTVPYNAASNSQDTPNSSAVSTSSISVPQIHVTPPQIVPSNLPPPFSNPGMASLHNQQQQLQPFQQFHQEQSTQVQYPGSNRSPNPTQPYYPPFMPSSSQMLPSYPLPPQFANSYQQMMPAMAASSSQAPYQPTQHQGVHGYSNQHQNQHVHSQPPSNFQKKHQQQEQASQPMNLSHSSQRMSAASQDNNDDYDS